MRFSVAESTRFVSTPHAAIAAIFAACFVNNLLVGIYPNPSSELFLPLYAFWLGACIGQLNLISVWAALSPGSPVLRLPVTCLLVVLMWLSIVIGNRMGDGISDGEIVEVGGLLMFFAVVAQLPLWIASRVFGWRLVRPDATDRGLGSRFNLRELLLATTLLALSLAITRVLLPAQLQFEIETTLYVVLAVLACVNLGIVMPTIWWAFRPYKASATIMTWVVASLGSAVAETLLFYVLLGTGPEPDRIVVVLAFINLGQTAVCYLALKALQLAGLRLSQTGTPYHV